MHVDTELEADKAFPTDAFGAIRRVCRDLRDDLRTTSGAERMVVFLWLTGPFVYLIESAPADIWLGTIVVAFVVRSVVLRDWAWMTSDWVRAVSIFVVACLVSSALSNAPILAAGKTIAWVRFPLYAAAVAFWLAVAPARQRAMLAACAVGGLVLCGILAAEMIAEPENFRLSGLYGDPKAGGYLAKLAMPVSTVLVIVSIHASVRRAILIALLPLTFVLFTIYTGDRMHAALAVTAVCLAAVSAGRRLRWIAICAAVGAAALILLANLKPTTVDRFVVQSESTAVDFFGSPYWTAMRPGIVGFMENPIAGIGVHLHERVCPDLPGMDHLLPGVTQCLNHPHQHYVQLAEETGLLGLAAGIAMILAFVNACWRGREVAPWAPNRSVRQAAWIVPVVLFFPQINADFFGQWSNLFVWFALGLALAMAQGGSERKRSAER